MKRLLIAGGAAVLAAGVGLVGATASADTADHPSKADALSTAISSADALVKSDDSNLFVSAADKLTRSGATNTLGLNFVEYNRTYHGLPVMGGDAVVATDSKGDVKYSHTSQSKEINLDTIKPKISAKTAQDTVGAKASDADLVVLAWDTPALAYVSTEKGVDEEGTPTKTATYVDANTGKKLASVDKVFNGKGNTFYNGKGEAVDVGTSKGGDGFVMEDGKRAGLSCGEEGGDTYTKAKDTWGDATGTDLETGCVDALFAADTEWDMLAEWLDRDGVDGKGNSFPISVGLDEENAYWDGSSTHFGHSADNKRQATSMDVVGHEFGHGVFENTPGGSMGGNETGGINEGAGDIFGTLTEWYSKQANDEAHDPPDYVIGEEVGLAEAGKPIRDMTNPDNVGNPACWSKDIPDAEVHDAAGPIDHWFYLLAEGTEKGGDGVPGSPTCDDSTIKKGLGTEAAGQIWLGAMMGKTSNWTYTDARTAALEFAGTSDLYDSCAQYDATKKAFDAISVPADADPKCSK